MKNYILSILSIAALLAPSAFGQSTVEDTTSTYGSRIDSPAEKAAFKTALNLEQVDNTSDDDKPVSTAQQTALDGKVGTTGDEIIAGDIDFTGQLTAANQTATEADDVMTRKLTLEESLNDSTKVMTVQLAMATRTSASGGATYSSHNGVVLVNDGTSGGYGWAKLLDGWPYANFNTGTGFPWGNGVHGFSVDVAHGPINTDTTDSYIQFGSASNAATPAPLAVRGIGIKRSGGAGGLQYQLIAHDGTTLTTGAAFNPPGGMNNFHKIVLLNDGATGTVKCYAADTPSGRLTLVSTISGGPTTNGVSLNDTLFSVFVKATATSSYSSTQIINAALIQGVTLD